MSWAFIALKKRTESGRVSKGFARVLLLVRHSVDKFGVQSWFFRHSQATSTRSIPFVISQQQSMWRARAKQGGVFTIHCKSFQEWGSGRDRKLGDSARSIRTIRLVLAYFDAMSLRMSHAIPAVLSYLSSANRRTQQDIRYNFKLRREISK